MAAKFRDGSFKSASGDAIKAKIINGVLAAKFADSNEFTEFIACDDGWWWAGPADYAVKIHGDDLLVSKGIVLGGNPVIYKRV